MLDQDKIINFLRVSGPSLPAKVAKNINTDILLASAYLSDLVKQSKVKISNLKIGGSPLYYLPGQEEQIYKFAAGNINPKDHQVLVRLKERKLLKENELELLAKVALRSLKDFAEPIHVTIAGVKELFWKWYLTTDEELREIIQKEYMPQQPMEQPLPQETIKPVEADEVKEVVQKKLIEEENKVEVKGEVKEEQKEKSVEEEKVVEEKEIKEEKAEEKKESIEKTEKEEAKKEFEKVEKIKRAKPKAKRKRPKKVVEEKSESIKEEEKAGEKDLEENKQEIKEEPEKVIEKEDEKAEEKKAPKKTSGRRGKPDEFLPVIEKFLQERDIRLLEHDVVRKNAEVNCMVEIPSVVGKITYFCKAKNKSRCDEKDLSAAYMEAQIKKLPLLFLYAKEINKKGKEMFDSGAFENAIVKRIE